jgi:hypothetical protein
MAPPAALSLERFVRGREHDASVARDRQRQEARRQAKLTKQYHTALRREGFEVDAAARAPRAPAPTLLARRKGKPARGAAQGSGEEEGDTPEGDGPAPAPAAAAAAAAAPARGGFAHAQALANQRRLDADRARLDAETREKDRRRKLRERKQRTLKLQQRTHKGQPLMNRRIDLLLEKIQKTA